MGDDDWLDDLPVIGKLSPDEAARRLRSIGESEIADALDEEFASPGRMAVTYDIPWHLGGKGERIWRHSSHAIGYLGPATDLTQANMPIRHAADINPDRSLKEKRIKITLDALRVADYPGTGMHQVLVSFSARNQTDQGPEHLHFNTTCRVRDGEMAAVFGRPIFVGLLAGNEGIFLQVATLNVKNDDDEALLRFLDSDVLKSGLYILNTVQPALAPFSALTLGLTRAIASRTQNIAVQAVDLGLDFSAIAPRPRLAEGSYLAVQMPPTLQASWNWHEWVYDRQSGRIIKAAAPDQSLPYNYLVIGVSRQAEK
jgi:hypothetical protein